VIRDYLPESHITAIEPSPMRAETLRTQPGIDVVETTLEEYLDGDTPGAMRRYPGHAAGRELDGRTWDEYPATVTG
jgi:hypothetical protein